MFASLVLKKMSTDVINAPFSSGISKDCANGSPHLLGGGGGGGLTNLLRFTSRSSSTVTSTTR